MCGEILFFNKSSWEKFGKNVAILTKTAPFYQPFNTEKQLPAPPAGYLCAPARKRGLDMKKQFLFVAFLLAPGFLFSQNDGSGRPSSGEKPAAGRPGGNREGGNFDPKNLPAIGKVWGSVADSLTGEPIPFATITLKSQLDSTYLTGGVTDEKGRFSISDIRLGSYKMSVDFIGFEKTERKIRLNQRSGAEQNLGTIRLLSSGVELATAEVVADKPLIINAIDRKIFNVEKLMTAAGGSATDVMRQVPLIQVDLDGNLSMRGSDNLTVLIDGRPSGLTGAGRKALLENLPASSIESIEIITNPSAKFDPDGTSGIVNIILKKNKLAGTSGSVQFGIGTREKYNAGGQANFRKNRWNTFLNYSFKYENNDSRGSSLRENFESTGARRSIFDQKNNGENRSLNNFVKLGADYNINPKTVVGISATLGKNHREEDENLRAKIFFGDQTLKNTSSRTTDQNGNSTNTDLNLNLKHEFKERGHSLAFDVLNARNNGLNARDFINQNLAPDGETPIGDPFLQKTANDNEFQLTTAQVDYTRPFVGQKGKFEAGAKSSFRRVDTNFDAFDFDETTGNFVDDPTRSNRFLFDENIYAAYINVNRKFGRFGAQAGLRAEKAETLSRLIDSEESFPNDYESLFPSLFFTYDLAPQRSIGLNYSKRINRPSTEALNPFADLSDTLNLFHGNPFLRPEYIHSFELSSQFFLGKFNFVPMLYFRRTLDGISRFQFIDPVSGVAQGTQVNIDSQNAWGYDLVLNGSIFKWWSLSASTNGSYSTFNAENLGDSITNKSAFRMWNRMASNWSLPRNWDIQVTAMVSPNSRTLLGKHYGMNSADVAISKKFWRDNATISLRLADIFDTRRHKGTVETPQFTRKNYRKRESQIAFLNFTYKFGKLTEQKSRGQNRRQEGGGQGGGEEF